MAEFNTFYASLIYSHPIKRLSWVINYPCTHSAATGDCLAWIQGRVKKLDVGGCRLGSSITEGGFICKLTFIKVYTPTLSKFINKQLKVY